MSTMQNVVMKTIYLNPKKSNHKVSTSDLYCVFSRLLKHLDSVKPNPKKLCLLGKGN